MDKQEILTQIDTEALDTTEPTEEATSYKGFKVHSLNAIFEKDDAKGRPVTTGWQSIKFYEQTDNGKCFYMQGESLSDREPDW